MMRSPVLTVSPREAPLVGQDNTWSTFFTDSTPQAAAQSPEDQPCAEFLGMVDCCRPAF